MKALLCAMLGHKITVETGNPLRWGVYCERCHAWCMVTLYHLPVTRLGVTFTGDHTHSEECCGRCGDE